MGQNVFPKYSQLIMIKAEVIQDSINNSKHRITTFVLRFPRIILAELNTHRAFSKNSASSRAIPFNKMLEMVTTYPFIPIRFQKDHKGMQGVEYYEGAEHEQCVKDWLAARDAAVKAATSFALPVTKQLRNRLLEPFLWHTVILTGTEFENFFALRAHKDAEIHMIELAYRMLEAYNQSIPKLLQKGEWHVPFGDQMDDGRIVEFLSNHSDENPETVKLKIAVARCARISYQNFHGKDDYNADIDLCNKLFANSPKHLSPTEHVAQNMDSSERSGNFIGWKQYRKFFADENLTDNRVVK
jgi:thymidylate synthase ThyX